MDMSITTTAVVARPVASGFEMSAPATSRTCPRRFSCTWEARPSYIWRAQVEDTFQGWRESGGTRTAY